MKPYRFEHTLNEPGLVFYSVKEEPFDVYGLYDFRNREDFRRLPQEVADATNPGVAGLASNTAGGRVRFCTDSTYVAVKIELPKVTRFSHMPLSGTTGMDLYVDGEGGSYYCKTFLPPADVSDGYEGIVTFPDKKMRFFTLHMPSYNRVSALYVGVDEAAQVGHGKAYLNKLPIVYYGSSITQGGCSSRPGLIYQNMIARRMNLDYVNLGFSGNAKAEDAIVEYMASMEMLAFVSDYDHNAPGPEHLRATHQKMYDCIRAAHPDIPYLMISKPDFATGTRARGIARRDVVIDTYRHARALGDQNVYYIDGEGFFRGPDEDSCTVDGVHPNDLGFSKMASGIGKVLDRALRGIRFGGEEE